MNVDTRPRVGVAAVVWRDGSKSEFLLGRGHSSVEEELYAVTGGHWESGETLAEAIRRETLEEAGIEVAELSLISVYEFFNEEKARSYVSIGFEAIWAAGEPEVMERDKKLHWSWYSPSDALALPLFSPDRVLIERAADGGPLFVDRSSFT